jgi:hypothetical protein
VSRSFVLGLLVVWAAAAALLYYLAPALAATYLVASGWLAVGAAAVWALTKWPPFKRTLTRRLRNPSDPGGPGPAR